MTLLFGWFSSYLISAENKIIPFQSKDLLQLAHEFGNSLYVHDAKVIEQQYNRLLSTFSRVVKLRINNVMKELSNVTILKKTVKLTTYYQFRKAELWWMLRSKIHLVFIKLKALILLRAFLFYEGIKRQYQPIIIYWYNYYTNP